MKINKPKLISFKKAYNDGGCCHNDNYNISVYGIKQIEYIEILKYLNDKFGMFYIVSELTIKDFSNE